MKFRADLDQENLEYLKTIMPHEVTSFRLVRDSPHVTKVNSELKDYNKVRKCLTTMRKYAKNPWWLSNDPLTIAYYTLIERTLVIDYFQFKDALKQLVHRDITSEFLQLHWYQLTVEVSRLFYGRPMSKAERKELYSDVVTEYVSNLPLKQKCEYYLHPLSHAEVMRLSAILRQRKAEANKG